MRMGKRTAKTKRLLIFLCVAALLVLYFIYYSFFSLHPLPYSTLIKETWSPDNTYKINVYVSSPPLSSSAVWCELLYGTKKKKVIYVDYKEYSSDLTWLADDVIEINGKRLHLPNEVYDWRRHKD